MTDFRGYQKHYRHQRKYVEDFLKENENTHPIGNEALKFSERIHNDQYRIDGAPYIVHPFEVVYYLLLIGFSDDLSIGAGFSHDGPEDKRTTHEEVEEQLTKAAGRIIRLLTNPSKDMNLDEFAEHLMKIFEEIRSLVIKVCDRVANMKRSMIGYFNKKKLIRYCDEGEYVFIPMLEGFIAVIEDPALLDPKYNEMYGQHARSLRVLRSFLKGFVQAGREHIKLMEKNEALEIEIKELKEKLCELSDYEP